MKQGSKSGSSFYDDWATKDQFDALKKGVKKSFGNMKGHIGELNQYLETVQDELESTRELFNTLNSQRASEILRLREELNEIGNLCGKDTSKDLAVMKHYTETMLDQLKDDVEQLKNPKEDDTQKQLLIDEVRDEADNQIQYALSTLKEELKKIVKQDKADLKAQLQDTLSGDITDSINKALKNLTNKQSKDAKQQEKMIADAVAQQEKVLNNIKNTIIPKLQDQLANNFEEYIESLVDKQAEDSLNLVDKEIKAARNDIKKEIIKLTRTIKNNKEKHEDIIEEKLATLDALEARFERKLASLDNIREQGINAVQIEKSINKALSSKSQDIIGEATNLAGKELMAHLKKKIVPKLTEYIQSVEANNDAVNRKQEDSIAKMQKKIANIKPAKDDSVKKKIAKLEQDMKKQADELRTIKNQASNTQPKAVAGINPKLKAYVVALKNELQKQRTKSKLESESFQEEIALLKNNISHLKKRVTIKEKENRIGPDPKIYKQIVDKLGALEDFCECAGSRIKDIDSKIITLQDNTVRSHKLMRSALLNQQSKTQTKQNLAKLTKSFLKKMNTRRAK